MKYCKDCRFRDDGFLCQHPNAEQATDKVDGARIYSCRAMRARSDLCGNDSNWFEPRLPDPGEGWRLLGSDEVICENDEFWNVLNGKWDSSVSVEKTVSETGGYSYRRRIIHALAKCPEGHNAILRVDGKLFCIVCEGDCWRGPKCITRELAVEEWNNVMAKVQIGKDATTRPV